jgi:beta-lactamase regulating signal transducer with metallopeptidase domain
LISDEELRAALHHERAHLLHGDQMLAAACSFLVDLLPLPAADFVDAYRTARELAADQDAARATNAEALAGALIEFAKGHRVIAEAACLIDGRASATTQRLRVLLGKTASGRRVDPYRRVALALALAAIFIAGVITPSMASQHAASCTVAMKASR